MMIMYALERRDRRFIVAFATSCLLSSAYGFLAGAWPFGVVEAIWSGVLALCAGLVSPRLTRHRATRAPLLSSEERAQ